jgi:rare lipoprotein A
MYVPAPPPVTPLVGLEPPGIEASDSGGSAATLRVRRRSRDVLANHRVVVGGRLVARGDSTGLPGRTVVLQMLGRRWATVARAHTDARGSFLLRFVPRHIGSARLRVRLVGEHGPLAARRIGRLNVYRPVQASWYGGGGSLACGGSLTSLTRGVANRTLPCGTIVTLHLGSHTVRVPVVDRGPFVAGREFDLTSATRRALGFGDTGQIWSTR